MHMSRHSASCSDLLKYITNLVYMQQPYYIRYIEDVTCHNKVCTRVRPSMPSVSVSYVYVPSGGPNRTKPTHCNLKTLEKLLPFISS